MTDLGVSKVTTLTSTYDHRVIQGATSGEFLKKMHELLPRSACAEFIASPSLSWLAL